MKLTLILAVHNEALFLPYLDVVLNYVDEAIIVDSSPFGPSDDDTSEILEDYARRYPGIELTHGLYRRNDGIRDYTWDEAKVNNFMISQASGDFLLFHHADIIYDVEDLEKIRKAIDAFPTKLIFYTNYLEFMWDTYHLHLRPDSLSEPAFFRPLTGYAFVVSKRANPTWRNYPLGLQLGIGLDMTIALFCPHIRRWHFANCKPYPLKVAHACRQIATGDLKVLLPSTELDLSVSQPCRKLCSEASPRRNVFGETDKTLSEGVVESNKKKGFDDRSAEECFNGAIRETENIRGQGFEYCGDYPEIMKDWRPSCEDGKSEFYQNIDFYKDKLSRYFRSL